METTQVLYTRNFSDLGPLQEARILQYALTEDPQKPLPYGAAVTELRQEGCSAQACRAILSSREDAIRLLIFLWENGIEPSALPGLVDDMRRAKLLPL